MNVKPLCAGGSFAIGSDYAVEQRSHGTESQLILRYMF
jgi:hypothetical protein